MKLFYKILLYVLLAYKFQISAGSNLPTFQKCKLDNNLNTCLQSAIQDAMPRLRKGIPDIGVNALDPMIIAEVKFGGKTLGSVSQNYSNVKLVGIADAIVGKVGASINDRIMELNFTLSTQSVLISGEYQMKGKLLAHPIDSKGKFSWKFENTTYLLSLFGKASVIKSKTYIIIEQARSVVTVSKWTSNDRIFNGNEALTDQLHKALKENWRNVAKELVPDWGPELGKLGKSYANKIFSNIPFKEMFIIP